MYNFMTMRVCNGMVYLQPYKVTIIFFVEDIIA